MGVYDIIQKDLLIQERERLATIKEKVGDRLENIPLGRLELGKSNGIVQYILYKDGKRIYLPKKDIKLVKKLAQKTYDERVLRCVNKRLSQIERFLKDYEDNEIENLYLRENVQRRKLIEPVELTFQQRLNQWLTEPYVGMGFHGDAPVILSNKGLRVRSKSEKIMADYFDSMGIQYKYECPLELKPYGAVYPDFTFLSSRTGEEIYWEHEGMMDKPEYARTAVQKIELYESNGIFPGENLILTFETSLSSINMNLIKELTEKYIMKN